MSLSHLLFRVQIIVNRPCDSYNLNSSPLCNLTDRRSPLYWAGDAAALYSQQTEAVPDYVALLDGPSRRLYPGDRFKQEVLLPNTTGNKEIEYNAVEKDVAVLNIFFVAANCNSGLLVGARPVVMEVVEEVVAVFIKYKALSLSSAIPGVVDVSELF